MSKVPDPGSLPLKKQRSSGRIVRPGMIEEVEPTKTTPTPTLRAHQSMGTFHPKPKDEEFDPRDVPADQVEVFEPQGKDRESLWRRWIGRFAPGRSGRL